METNKQRRKEELDLIFEFEMEYGNEDNWSDEIKEIFNKEWDEIQRRYR